MDVYDTIFNTITNDWSESSNIPITPGLKAVDEHMTKYGINSEEAEYMWDLAKIDTWIIHVINKDDIT